ncbi:fungal-specific transcription factor domain-containing protein [Dactylonectria estremocensis]|uniref:Fungal-specific transcription factor domain-containing protein n=1 Tax=Dactylonectria estremocensis TaxID=1079267 RepID=A0A9P9I8V3_9HYPO|nr:fungal-specific transcription factor domain-containing protein [Dactylonectria estremocensis]KAH7112323.1 fungal-specific transcription factor domain-containing protein [Dactylonectria estremocensis]
MSQCKPRQFKFVGGPSRKRRRRNEPKASDADLRSSGPVEPKDAAPATNHGHGQGEEHNAEGPPAPKLPISDKENRPRPTEATATSMTTSNPGPLTLSPTAGEFDLLLSWPNGSSFMNPFLDPSPVFSDPSSFLGGQFQLPTFLGPDMDFSHPHSSPSTDSSAEIISNEDWLANGDTGDVPAAGFVAETTERTAARSPSPIIHEPSSSADSLSRLLARYDEEFCILPLTNDFEANPFRYNIETGRGSQLLLHCILALSYKHVNRDTGGYYKEATHHKKQAVQLLRDMEAESKCQSFEPTFLDAVLILMTLDCATSAHGPWLSYLHRAHRILEATEALNVTKTPRMKAQIDMLVWWDVTLAMTSRQGCVLSESTIMNQFNSNEAADPTFYNISGCPEDLFKHMIRLGTYARELELASTMTCVNFDVGPVLAVEKSITEWSAPEFNDLYEQNLQQDDSIGEPKGPDSEELAHYKQDLHHCAEAWRYGLLIYIEKVFKWRRKKAPSPLLGFLARKTLNNVLSCRRNLMLQKQLLLPVFLAGCETKDKFLRQEARDYCNWWNEKTRYDMFLTTTALLEEVWATKDPQSWWGSIIDDKTRAGTGSAARQYLFG